MSTHGEIRNTAFTVGEPAGRPPTRRSVRAAWVAALAATVGFMPLHLVWAAGIPLFADTERFESWHADGGGTYLWALNALAVLPAVLAFALIRPWGLVLPRWVPGIAGRRVPRLLLIVPGYSLAAALAGYTVFAVFLSVVQWNAPEAIFNPWTGVYGIAHFTVWITALAVATRSYAVRTRG